jgi:hypothetical protein
MDGAFSNALAEDLSTADAFFIFDMHGMDFR